MLKYREEGVIHLMADCMAWGFPRFDGKGLLINARAESAMERKTFRNSVQHRRCIIPAKSFYEWDKAKKSSLLNATILQFCSWLAATISMIRIAL